jgi:N-sulfoglucosamine sulfohydrolase
MNTSSKMPWLLLACFLSLPLVTLLASSKQRESQAERPNIVFLLADDVNCDTWGTYGGENCKTPNIDQLAKDGMRFDRAYCSVAMCAPFRQELYSGRSPWRTGTLANHSKSKSGTKSLPHYLQPLGYRVVLLGKSHVGPKTSYPFEHINHGDKKKDHNPFYLKKAGEIMDQSKKNKKPFCLFVTSNDGHGPYTTGDPSAYRKEDFKIPPYWLDTPNLRGVLLNYYAEITNFDKLVGQMRTALETRGLWENTVFIVCGEQGTGLPFAKWTCYRNGLQTGLVAHWKGRITPGSVAEELISISDIAPTLVTAVGGSYGKNDFDGKSFLPTLKGVPQELHNYVFGAFTNCNIIGSGDRIFPIRSVRSKRHSLLYNPNYRKITSNVTLDDALSMLEKGIEGNGSIASSWVRRSEKDPNAKQLVHKLHHRPEYELYDLEKDPHELLNVIDQSEYIAIAEKLKLALTSRLRALGDSNPIETEMSLVKKHRSKH